MMGKDQCCQYYFFRKRQLRLDEERSRLERELRKFRSLNGRSSFVFPFDYLFMFFCFVYLSQLHVYI